MHQRLRTFLPGVVVCAVCNKNPFAFNGASAYVRCGGAAWLPDPVQPSLDARAAVNTAEVQLVDALARRQTSDAESQRLMSLVVNSIKGDPELGDDSALYEAAGYVRRSERKSAFKL